MPPGLAAVLVLLVVAAATSCGSGAAASDAGAIPSDEQRLVATIVARQQVQADQAARAAQSSSDEAAALRLQQRILTQYGRPDLAAGLDTEAAAKERDARAATQDAAEQEAVLMLYVDYARRAGVPSAGADTATPAPDSRGPRATRTRPDRAW